MQGGRDIGCWLYGKKFQVGHSVAEKLLGFHIHDDPNGAKRKSIIET